MKRSILILIILVMLVGAGIGLAQTNVVGTNAPVPSPTISIPLSSIPTWLQLLIMPATFALVAAVKKWLPAVKPVYLPFIVPFVGAAINILIDLVGAWGNQGLLSSAVTGAALGGLSTWLHQVGKQTVEIRQASSDTPPSAP